MLEYYFCESYGKGYGMSEKTGNTNEGNCSCNNSKDNKKDMLSGFVAEVTFTSLIFSLSSSALLSMGEITDPATGKKMEDFTLAKHTIDTIVMLKEKTKGNLTAEEEKFVAAVCADLKLRYASKINR